MRKRHQSFDSAEISAIILSAGTGAILGDEVPNFRKVVFYFRVKSYRSLLIGLARRTSCAQARFISSPLMASPGRFEIVIAAVEGLRSSATSSK